MFFESWSPHNRSIKQSRRDLSMIMNTRSHLIRWSLEATMSRLERTWSINLMHKSCSVFWHLYLSWSKCNVEEEKLLKRTLTKRWRVEIGVFQTLDCTVDEFFFNRRTREAMRRSQKQKNVEEHGTLLIVERRVKTGRYLATNTLFRKGNKEISVWRKIECRR